MPTDKDPIHILILDDEESIRWVFQKTLKREGYVLHVAASAEEAAGMMKRYPIHLALVDINLPGDDGLSFMVQQLKLKPDLMVAIITGEGTMDNAVRAMKLGAFDYLTKPFDIGEIETLAARSERIIREGRSGKSKTKESATSRSPAEAEELIVGKSRPIREIYKSIGRVAPSDITVLVLGESGTGKELIARAIHHHSERAGQPFVAINCAAIPKDLLESELFGHERGAFTGATERKTGRIEQARGGTLLLDEIGDMPLELQAKLLRVLQEREYQRVGGVETLKVRARIVAATNRSLETRVETGAFRQDLYYRINSFTIEIPPLRDRREDIPLLVEFFLRKGARELGLPPRMVTPSAMARIAAYGWPGNVRELENTLKSLMIMAASGVIDLGDLPRNLLGGDPSSGEAGQSFEAVVVRHLGAMVEEYCREGKSGLLDEAEAHFQRPLIRQVLMKTGWNQLKAAEILGINRNTLRTRIETLAIHKPADEG